MIRQAEVTPPVVLCSGFVFSVLFFLRYLMREYDYHGYGELNKFGLSRMSKKHLPQMYKESVDVL